MFTKRTYSARQMFQWTLRELVIFSLYATFITTLYHTFNVKWLHLPWAPLTLIGTAVAFIISFQNKAAYDRIWEARKIWGGIINSTRAWSSMLFANVQTESKDLLKPSKESDPNIKTLIFRHIAWITALRYAMRQTKPWEVFFESKRNKKLSSQFVILEHTIPLQEALQKYLSKEDYQYVENKKNICSALIHLQNQHLRQLQRQEQLWEFSYIELEKHLVHLLNLQGKTEGIKNFPYPRQYATLGSNFVSIFIFFLPFAIIPVFADIQIKLVQNMSFFTENFVWLAVPFSTMLSWIFHTMERIGRVGENPFEGTSNDVPISTISRNLEIELLQFLNEHPDAIPKPLAAQFDIQM